MKPLFGQSGRVVAFVGRRNRIIGLRGQSLGFLHGEQVYDYAGKHLGWWSNNHMRGHDGGLTAFFKGTKGTGLILPIPQIPPIAPIPSIEPIRPIRQIPPIKPIRKLGWSDFSF